MHFGDYTFIFLLALVLFGPKKLPEIGRQLGKLLAEFRRASNEFKFQIQDELRNMEEEERRKKAAELEAARAIAAPERAAPADVAALPASTEPTILPPSIGTSVSTSKPFASPAAGEPAAVEPADGSSIAPETEVQVDPSLPTDASTAPVSVAADLESEIEPQPHIDLAAPALTESENGVHPPAQKAATHHD
jgi:sec-independent protein translocase protein TatB